MDNRIEGDRNGAATRRRLGLLLLLVGLLTLLAVFLPTSDAVEKAKQAAKNERADSQQLPVVSLATEP